MHHQCLIPEVCRVGTTVHFSIDEIITGKLGVQKGDPPFAGPPYFRSHYVCSVSQDWSSRFGVKCSCVKLLF